MQLKSLKVAAFILGLGVVAGCDDPEVLDKVESVVLNGAVQAQAYCYVSGIPACSSTSYNYASFRASLFQDESLFLNINFRNGYGQDVKDSDIYRRGDEVKVSALLPQGRVSDEYVILSEGELALTRFCQSTTPPDYETQLLDLSTDMTCTGFNLEAFGIDP